MSLVIVMAAVQGVKYAGKTRCPFKLEIYYQEGYDLRITELRITPIRHRTLSIKAAALLRKFLSARI
jgi:hypothetical protein